MKCFCAKQVNLHYGIEFHNAKFTRNTKFINLPFIIRYLYKIKKPHRTNLQLKLLIGSREIVNLSYVSQCTNTPRLAQTKAPR